jgi:putative acetyltransferase
MSNNKMIRPIQAEDVAEARQMIYKVAHELMEPEMSLEEVTALWDSWGAFDDMNDIQSYYFKNGGVFLVTVDGEKIIGTGAFWRYEEDGVCEVKRIALLPEYQGQGMGYAMMVELMRRAREMGYRKMCLWTNRYKLTRAIAFYQRLGFVEVPHEGADDDEIWMEKEIV